MPRFKAPVCTSEFPRVALFLRDRTDTPGRLHFRAGHDLLPAGAEVSVYYDTVSQSARFAELPPEGSNGEVLGQMLSAVQSYEQGIYPHRKYVRADTRSKSAAPSKARTAAMAALVLGSKGPRPAAPPKPYTKAHAAMMTEVLDAKAEVLARHRVTPRPQPELSREAQIRVEVSALLTKVDACTVIEVMAQMYLDRAKRLTPDNPAYAAAHAREAMKMLETVDALEGI